MPPKRRSKNGVVQADLILEAAQKVFEREGLEGASLRAIAAEAAYTPAALYFHFSSKEAIYAAMLSKSLAALRLAVEKAADGASSEKDRYAAASLGFFDFYKDRPRDLDLGFYLLRGGLRPRGLGRELDRQMNEELDLALRPIAQSAQAHGLTFEQARSAVVDAFAYAVGLLILLHTRRMRLFDTTARGLMIAFLERQTQWLSSDAGGKDGGESLLPEAR